MTECTHVPERMRRPGRWMLCGQCQAFLRGVAFKVGLTLGARWPGVG